MKCPLTKEFLIQDITNRKSSLQIAKSTGWSSTTVVKYLNKYSIRVRTTSENSKGRYHSHWKGGIYKCCSGYCYIHQPKHPYSNKQGYVPYHRYVVEKKIGRYLKPVERVHHRDLDKHNNKITNLILFSCTKTHNCLHILAYKYLVKTGQVLNYIKWYKKESKNDAMFQLWK